LNQTTADNSGHRNLTPNDSTGIAASEPPAGTPVGGQSGSW
jgi:hypothetical protein